MIKEYSTQKQEGAYSNASSMAPLTTQSKQTQKESPLQLETSMKGAKETSIELRIVNHASNISTSQQTITTYELHRNWGKNVQLFCEQYKEDMPNVDIISHEIDNWESLWATRPVDTLPTSISETLKVVTLVSFPKLFTVLRILGTLSITSCSYERAASSVRLLKTYYRSTKTRDRLNGLASLYTHKDIDVPIKEVIDKFTRTS